MIQRDSPTAQQDDAQGHGDQDAVVLRTDLEEVGLARRIEARPLQDILPGHQDDGPDLIDDDAQGGDAREQAQQQGHAADQFQVADRPLKGWQKVPRQDGEVQGQLGVAVDDEDGSQARA